MGRKYRHLLKIKSTPKNFCIKFKQLRKRNGDYSGRITLFMKIWLCRRHCLIISVFYASRSCWHCILRGYIIKISRQAVKLWSAKLYLDNKYWLANLSGWTAQLEQPFLRNTFGLLLLNRLWKLLDFYLMHFIPMLKILESFEIKMKMNLGTK